MVERIEDLNLPNSVVTRLMKEALPCDVKIASESRTALTRATSVFVLYLTSAATAAAEKRKQKVLTVDHVLAGLEEIEFDSFIEPLKKDLEGKYIKKAKMNGRHTFKFCRAQTKRTRQLFKLKT